jgi:parvulin-like peptidyl-prolyl isomerase
MQVTTREAVFVGPRREITRSRKAVKLKSDLTASRSRSLVLGALLLALFAAPSASAQEAPEARVVDEPIAQVNNDVIMLSDLNRHLSDFREVLVKGSPNRAPMTEAQAEEELRKKQPEIIASLINERLLLQRGRDIPRLSEDIEAEVNRTMLAEAKRQGITTIEQLDAAMREAGLDPTEIRQTLRTQYMHQAVLQREVDAKIYYGLSQDELRKYYDTHRDQFQSVTLSEIFLSRAGRSEADVRAKAAQIVAQARGGTDFGTLAATNSEREIEGVRVAEKTKGRIEGGDGKPRWFLIADLHSAFAVAVKSLQAGQVSEPIATDEGFTILRVNERNDAFNEQQVRGEIVGERRDKEREAFIQALRRDAYISVATAYRDAVLPLLKLEKEPAAGAKSATTATNQKDKKSN